MSLSAYARLLYIGLWGEAYDDGVFEWKPLTLKARIFPCDNIDVPELLAELFSAGLIARAEKHPKQPGLIRNFQKFQRPKKPNSSKMLDDHWRSYVGASSEPVPNQFPTGTEKPPQMEDGGGNRKMSDANASSSSEAENSAPSVIDLPCVSGDPYPVVEADIAEWEQSFPAVDVRQQLGAMLSWLNANPKKRKTQRGMRKFVVGWLDRRQNAGGSAPMPQARGSPPRGDMADFTRQYLQETSYGSTIDADVSPAHGPGASRALAYSPGSGRH